MAQAQTYLLKWKDFGTNLVTSFKHLKDDGSYKDVTITCDGQSCKVHRLVLSTCSPYFETLLKDNPSAEPMIIMKDIPFNYIEWMVEFMYAGEVRIAIEHLVEFVKFANRFQVKGLADPENTIPIPIRCVCSFK